MIMTLKKICRCGKVIPYSIKRCPECEVKTEQERKQNIKYYKQNTYERDHALCKDCLAKNTITSYNTVHHIIPIKEDWSKKLDIDNLICLCESCHQRRHNSMKG